MVTMSEEEYNDLLYDYAGYCLACKQISYGHEPDARNNECELCGAHKVYGLEEAALIGIVKISG
jgi:hypothetical protein